MSNHSLWIRKICHWKKCIIQKSGSHEKWNWIKRNDDEKCGKGKQRTHSTTNSSEWMAHAF